MNIDGIDLVIVGGESGNINTRPIQQENSFFINKNVDQIELFSTKQKSNFGFLIVEY